MKTIPTAYDKPNIARRIYDALTSPPSSPTGVNYDQQISFGTASEVFHSLSLAGNLHNYGDPEGATKKFDYDHEISFGTASEVFHSLHNLQSNDGYAEIRGMEDRMMDTRALPNNTAGTSEYTEDETEKDFMDAKSDDGKYDKFEIRNRVTATETETLSLVTDFGKDAKENGNEGEVNGQDPKPEENKINDDDDEVQQDTLESGNRTVNEVLEPVDTLEMRKRNRTVNEIFSPVDDTLESGNRTVNEVLEPKENPKPEENKINDDDDRTVNEIFSPVADLGQDTRNETEKKDTGDTGDPKPKEIRDQGGGWGLEWG